MDHEGYSQKIQNAFNWNLKELNLKKNNKVKATLQQIVAENYLELIRQ